MAEREPYLCSAEEVLKRFDVDESTGLSDAAVKASRERWGSNELAKGEKTSLLAMVIEQFEDPLVITLLFAMLVSLGTNLYDYYNPGHSHGAAPTSFWESFVEPAVILFILIFNAIVGVWQEANAENALEALKNLQAEHVRARARAPAAWLRAAGE
jgi:Ca2+-transporting ATPase